MVGKFQSFSTIAVKLMKPGCRVEDQWKADTDGRM